MLQAVLNEVVEIAQTELSTAKEVEGGRTQDASGKEARATSSSCQGAG